MSATHRCPGGCGRVVPRHQLSCRDDWFRLPAELRRSINAAYRRDRGRHLELVGDALAWYRANPDPARIEPGDVDPLSLTALRGDCSAEVYEPPVPGLVEGETVQRLLPFYCTRDKAHPLPHVACGGTAGQAIAVAVWSTPESLRVLDDAGAERLGLL